MTPDTPSGHDLLIKINEQLTAVLKLLDEEVKPSCKLVTEHEIKIASTRSSLNAVWWVVGSVVLALLGSLITHIFTSSVVAKPQTALAISGERR